MGKYFGTDGFRGEAGITLTADHAYKVGRFLGWYYNALRERNGDTEPARIVIGKDTRRSSYMFEYSLVAGLTASGADAYLLHVTTTPSVAYIARVDDFDCGIMISASHNPYYDNGIKLIDCYGEKMPEETLLLVEDYIDGKLHVFDKDWPELPFAHREHIGCTVDYVAGRNRYMGYLISLGIYSFKGVKVGLDCANGSSWNIAKSVFDALGADTYVINNKPNGLNINNNAGSTHIEGLQKFVVEKGLDVGFAYDGDADRCLCVDEKGNVITGDHILYIYDAIEAGFNHVVFIIRKDIEKEFKEVIGDRIASICSSHNVTVDYAFQDINDIPGTLPEGRTKPWGTGQAVLAAKKVIKTPFIVINADDYYGKEGFKAVHECLVNGGKSCMAGFVLKNTLSDNGGVTRGICKMDEQNNLTEVVETKNIVKTATGAEADGVAVDVNSLVSMNMWGLTPEFLDVLEAGFKEFFKKEVPGNPLKAEYLIPIFIGELLEQGKMSVKVLKTNDTWYGMTYHEDVAAVKDSFKKMLENGVYKADLFSDL